MSRWMDVSQRLHAGVPVWPGDTPFDYHLTWTKADSGSVNVGQITMSTHTGTHIDAPFHFDEDGRRVSDLDVNLYIGPARLIRVAGVGPLSVAALAGADLTGVSRLLIATDAWTDRTRFPDSIPSVDPDFAPFLASKGVQLLGLDLPSVDPLDSKNLPAHHALAQNGVHILEGLVLAGLQEGDYELAALPLALDGADGSPVRAVLRPAPLARPE